MNPIVNNKLVTVATTAYNRAHLLPRLYESLLDQTSNNFCWLVIDDGSTDNTEELIRNLQKENRILITYIKKSNGGFPSAQNAATEHCSTPLYFEVDSDDWIPNDSIECICKNYPKIETNPKIAGFLALNATEDSKVLGNEFPKGLSKTTFWDSYYKHHMTSDLAIVFKADIRKRYRFDLCGNEKEMGSTYILYQIDDDYDMAVLPHVLKIVEYQDTGLSQGVRALPRTSPHNYMKNKLISINRANSPILVTEFLLLYLVAAMYLKRPVQSLREIESTSKRVYGFFLMPFAWVLKITLFK